MRLFAGSVETVHGEHEWLLALGREDGTELSNPGVHMVAPRDLMDAPCFFFADHRLRMREDGVDAGCCFLH